MIYGEMIFIGVVFRSLCEKIGIFLTGKVIFKGLLSMQVSMSVSDVQRDTSGVFFLRKASVSACLDINHLSQLR